MSKSVLDMKTDETFRDLMLDAICHGLGNDFRNIIIYVVDNKIELFNNEYFNTFMYEDEDLIIDLILPCVRRIWGEVFINPPSLFKDKRLEYFQLLFDIDEFIDYLIAVIPKMEKSLNPLNSLDRTSKTLELIIDNYVAHLVERTRNREDIVADIRDLKINKTLKK
jgi:hypothetical protein